MTGSVPPPASGGDIHAILVPREVVNADSVYLVEWLVPDGSVVEAGVEICVVETSKAAVTVEAEHSGYLCHRAVAGQEVPVGGIMGYITARTDTPLPLMPSVADGAERSEVKISAKARRMIQEMGLDMGMFEGKRFIRERDVLEVVASRGAPGEKRDDPRGPSRTEALGPVQRRVAQMMEESAFGIPAAYLECDVHLADIQQRARHLIQTSKVLVSPVDLLVAAVAKACTKFPNFNSSITEDYRRQLFERAHVGVAVDVEMDLYVVVVKDACRKSCGDIAKELRKLEYLAQRRQLGVEHLTGGTITVTSMIGRGVHRFHPLLYPGQAAIVGISDPKPGSDMSSLTLGFDHRIANGSEAAAFLASIKKAFQEAPESSHDA